MELASESLKAAAAIQSGSQIRHRRAVSLTEEIVDPDIDYSLVSKSANISDDEEADYAEVREYYRLEVVLKLGILKYGE